MLLAGCSLPCGASPHVRPCSSLPPPTGAFCSEVIGRNCRFLQGPSTDPQAVQQIREALAAQPPRPATVTLLNYRRPDASGHAQPFYNCLHIAPLRDAGASAVGQAPPSRGGIAWALRGMQEVCVRGLRVFLCFGGV